MNRLADPVAATTGLAAGGRAATILVVDDEAQNRKLLEIQLKPEGYVTQSAASGEEALASIARQQPDLILLDVMMPGMNGYEVARTLKANPATSNIPIIMVTAYDDHNARLAGLDAGAEEFLAKPVDRAELWLRVRNLLRMKALGDFFQDHNLILERRVAERTAELGCANDSLRESEARFRSLTEMSSDFFWESDAEHRLTTRGAAHRKPSTIAEFQRGEQIGKRRWEMQYLSPGESGWHEHRAALAAHLPVRNFEFSRRGADGSERHISISGDPVFDAAGTFKGYRGVGTDITERNLATAKFRRLTQLYAALSQCNEAIVRCASEEELLPIICRAAVQFGGMKMAWIGMIDPARRMLRFLTGVGAGVEDLQDIELSLDAEGPLGVSPTGRAIHDDQPVWCQDLRTDPVAAPWRERVARNGWFASASLPLHRNGVLVGAFVLYAGEANAFDEAARRLLVEMASDISFALDNFDRESQRKRMEEEILLSVAQLKSALMRTVELATVISEMRDPYTAGHERRVAEIAVAIGAELGFDAHRQEGLQVAGHLHDIGKMTVPAEILSKPGKLSKLEFELIKGHARASYDVLKGVEFPWLVAEVALQHHERIDGSGYPQGLKGDAILLEARIMAVADVVEAMSSHRPYRPGLGIDAALAEIERGRGTAYDPVVADACLKLFREAGYTLPK